MDALKPILAKLADGQLLTNIEAEAAFEILLNGQATEGQIGAFLMALRQRGETLEEMEAGARMMRKFALKVDAPENALDTCGTGGDGSGSYNISTAVAMVVAANGVPVAKHGNRALSSKSGSSQVLESLGVNLNLDPSAITQCLDEAGIGFMFAIAHHAAARHVGPVRQQLGLRTIFNLLGPMSNPAGAKRQLLGVFDRKWTLPMAQTLQRLGSERAWVVSGSDGMDEITTTGDSYIAEHANGSISEFTISPRDYGIELVTAEDLAGGTPDENAQSMIALLKGELGPYRDIVLLNSAAALIVGEKAATIEQGLQQAAEAIDSGAARKVLENLAASSKRLASQP